MPSVLVIEIPEAQATAFDELLAELSSEWSEPMRLRAEYREGIYTLEVKAAVKP